MIRLVFSFGERKRLVHMMVVYARISSAVRNKGAIKVRISENEEIARERTEVADPPPPPL